MSFVRALVGGALVMALGHFFAAHPDVAARQAPAATSAASASVRAAATTADGQAVTDAEPVGAGVAITVKATGFSANALVTVRDGDSLVGVQRAHADGVISFRYLTPATTGAHRLLMEQSATASQTGQGNVQVTVAPFAILAFGSS